MLYLTLYFIIHILKATEIIEGIIPILFIIFVILSGFKFMTYSYMGDKDVLIDYKRFSKYAISGALIIMSLVLIVPTRKEAIEIIFAHSVITDGTKSTITTKDIKKLLTDFGDK